MKNKRIAFVIGTLGSGGAEKNCVLIANDLTSKNINVDLIFNHATYSSSIKSISKYVKKFDFESIRTRYVFFKYLKYLLVNKPDVVFVFTPESQIVIGLIKIIFRLKFVFIVRNINTMSFIIKTNSFYERIYQVLWKITISKSNSIINQSFGMYKDFVEKWPIYQDKCVLIENAVQKITFNFNCIPLATREKYILAVGRLVRQKRFDHLIFAFKGISQKTNLNLYIAGEGPELDNLKSISIEHGLKNRIKFLGNVDEPGKLYSKAKLTVLTSLYEGYPNVLTESISFGTPVVSYNCPSGPSEIIIDGVNGFLVENGNIKQLSKIILKALDHEFDLNKIRKTVEKNSVELIAQKYLNLCTTFLDQKN